MRPVPANEKRRATASVTLDSPRVAAQAILPGSECQ